MSRMLPAALLAAAALVVTIIWQAQGSTGPSLGETIEPPPLPGIVRDTLERVEDDGAPAWVATALERPLFRAGRRPAAASNDVAVKSEKAMRLTGVMTGSFGSRAIFTPADGAKSIVAQEGVRVGNFMVRSIGPGWVVVDTDGDIRTLKPSFLDGKRPLRP